MHNVTGSRYSIIAEIIATKCSQMEMAQSNMVLVFKHRLNSLECSYYCKRLHFDINYKPSGYQIMTGLPHFASSFSAKIDVPFGINDQLKNGIDMIFRHFCTRL